MLHIAMTRRLFISVVALILSVNCAMAQAQQSRLKTILKSGHVTVGVTSQAKPFGFINKDRQLVGFDVDIAKLIARSLFGEKGHIKLVKQPFSARWANVKSEKIDFGIQLTTIYPDRLRNVAFTRPYLSSGLVLVTRKDVSIKRPSDLNKSKYTVAHLTAPNEKDISQRLFPKAGTHVYDSVASEMTSVMSGRANAAIVDRPIAMYYAKNHENIKILNNWLTTPTNFSIFLKQGNFTWWHYLDSMVREMRSGSLYHEYSQIYKKWFGKLPENLNKGAH